MKFKNILNKLAIGLAFTAVAASCTDDIKFGDAFIEKAPEDGSVTKDSVYMNPTYLRQALTTCYALQYYGLPYQNKKYTPHSGSPYNGKLDGVTDLYHLHWASTALFIDYYGGTLTAAINPLISYDGDRLWQGINHCWELIENIDKCKDIDEATRKMYVAEAKCLIAEHYFIMFNYFGGLPIVKETNSASATSFSYPRATAEETVEFMVKLLDEAIPDLRWAWDGETSATNQDQTGRWTKAGAMALKAKTLTFAASPLYNSDSHYYEGASDNYVWYGNYKQERWERAEQACKEFFDAVAANGYYAMEQPAEPTVNSARLAYRKGYLYQTSHEPLHVTRVRVYDNAGGNGAYSWTGWERIGRNSYLPTFEYMEMFPWADGSKFDWSADSTKIFGTVNKITHKLGSGQLFYSYNSKGDKTPTRDPRLYEEILVNDMDMSLDWNTGTTSGDRYELWVGGAHEQFQVARLEEDPDTKEQKVVITESMTSRYSTGFGCVKYQLTGEDYTRLPLQWIFLGMSEMHLLYAECLAQNGKLAEANEWAQNVRARVGMTKSLKDVYPETATDKNAMIEQILRERACELGMTNNRYYDMCRYKRGDWMTKKLHGLVTLRLKQNPDYSYVATATPYIGDEKNADLEGTNHPNRFSYQKFCLQQPAEGRYLWRFNANDKEVAKWFVMPLPQWELEKQYGLVQNAGW